MAQLLKLDEDGGIPLWIQLRNRLAYLISVGHYAVGEQLPTVRGLAAEIGINYNTVNKVYQSLEREGYIATRRGLGTFVCDWRKLDATAPDSVASAVVDECVRKCLGLGMSLEDISREVAKSIERQRAD